MREAIAASAGDEEGDVQAMDAETMMLQNALEASRSEEVNACVCFLRMCDRVSLCECGW